MLETREKFVVRLADELLGRAVSHTLRVAIDGPDAAGKTILANDLAAQIGVARPVIRLSIDRFHNPRSVRLARGSLSPEGFYYDSFDHGRIIESVLRPLGPGRDGRYLPGAFDYRTDRPVVVGTEQAEAGAVLLFDGLFLLRPELRAFWDASVYLRVDPEVALSRARVRDVDMFGSVEVVEERYRHRYLPGQRLYQQVARPEERADIVLDMNDPLAPVVVRWVE
ncbi:uridylate kinase [Rugosimonospora africana]|uniref:Uridine kinase n=1 Tax=Rugosimonospora africana TaxID=556532 RepID=A0A8J3VQC6_9ACTN|nr:uridylate kinase [Rugosimonospora africana]GIH14995.1 uridine kinase [Rugosimonospora africana]